MSLLLGDNIGISKIADYGDKELNSQAGTIGTPSMTISIGGKPVSLDNQAIADLYYDNQNGDIGLSTFLGGVSIGITYNTDAAANKP